MRFGLFAGKRPGKYFARAGKYSAGKARLTADNRSFDGAALRRG